MRRRGRSSAVRPDASKLAGRPPRPARLLMAQIADIETRRPSPPRSGAGLRHEAERHATKQAAERALAAGQLRTEVETLAKLLMPVGDERPAAHRRPDQRRGRLRDGARSPRSARTSTCPPPRKRPCTGARQRRQRHRSRPCPQGVEPLSRSGRRPARTDAPPAPDRRRRREPTAHACRST